MSDTKSSETPPSSRDDSVLCPSCLAPSGADAHFCRECNAPLTPHAATDPLGRVFATGHVVQKAAARPQSRLVLVGMWMLFGSLFLSNLPALWYSSLALLERLFDPGGAHHSNYSFLGILWVFAISLGIEAIFVAILVKVTRNYRSHD